MILFSIFIISCNFEKYRPNKINQPKDTLKVVIVENFLGETFNKSLLDSFENGTNRYVHIFPFINIKTVLDSIKSNNFPYDIVLGIDDSFFRSFRKTGAFLKYQPKKLKSISSKFNIDKWGFFTPYAYSYICILADSSRIFRLPKTLGELQDNEYTNQIIIPDPIFTTVGKIFYAKTISRFSLDGHRHFWKSLEGNIRLIQKSERSSYNMFLAKEGAFIIGESTYPLSQILTRGYSSLKPILTDDFYIKKVQMVGILKNSKKIDIAKEFTEYLLGKSFQKGVSQNLWKFPVVENISLSSEFEQLKKLGKTGNDAVNYLYVLARVDYYLDVNKNIFK